MIIHKVKLLDDNVLDLISYLTTVIVEQVKLIHFSPQYSYIYAGLIVSILSTKSKMLHT